jgi:hypothetical protein
VLFFIATVFFVFTNATKNIKFFNSLNFFGAAYGATVANLLRVVGFEVDNEYYVNDAGRQMDIFLNNR